MELSLSINGDSVTVDVPPNTTLVQLLRDELQMTGTHVGCDTTQCGACTVLLDGEAVKSCNLLAAQCADREVTTIEGLKGDNGGLHPVQEAFHELHGLQCGFCTPGMVMSIVDLCNRVPDADEDQIREQLDGNYCRCTGYQNIVRAVQKAQQTLRT
ncbi:MAG TPA: (2Fe-2S)-binding protein [Arenicellales bacterium]|nr:(2Fe-2S)-binding protein [Arenicellales bacterium]